MQVSLKKADQLQKQLLIAANAIKADYVVKLTAYDKIETDDYVHVVFSNGRAAFWRTFHSADSLLTAGFEVRRLVGEANALSHADGSINDLVNRRALAEAKERQMLAFLNQMDETYVETLPEELVGSITQVRSLIANHDMDNLRHVSKTFEGTLVTPALRDGVQKHCNKARQERTEFADLLATRNMTTTIILPDFVVAVLREQQIIRAA